MRAKRRWGRVHEQDTAGCCNRHSILHSCRYVFPNDLCLDVLLLLPDAMKLTRALTGY